MIVVYTPMDGDISFENGARGAGFPSFRFRFRLQMREDCAFDLWFWRDRFIENSWIASSGGEQAVAALYG